MKIESKFDIGDELTDCVTGYTGIVMVVARYATGCTHYGLQPQSEGENGGLPTWEWLDESRLERKFAQKVLFNVKKNTTSGPFQSGLTNN